VTHTPRNFQIFVERCLLSSDAFFRDDVSGKVHLKIMR
jgi:hypothetical protein